MANRRKVFIVYATPHPPSQQNPQATDLILLNAYVMIEREIGVIGKIVSYDC